MYARLVPPTAITMNEHNSANEWLLKDVGTGNVAVEDR